MSGTTISMSPDLRELMRRVAGLPHGLGFLHQADVDCIAVTLGVHPFVVVEARRRLDTPEGRAYLIQALHLARAEEEEDAGHSGAEGTTSAPAGEEGASSASGAKRAASAPAGMPGPTTAPPDPSRRLGLRALLRAARRHPLGFPFLLEAPFESVAVTFRAHPFVVLQARALLARRESRRRNPGTSQVN